MVNYIYNVRYPEHGLLYNDTDQDLALGSGKWLLYAGFFGPFKCLMSVRGHSVHFPGSKSLYLENAWS